MRLTTASQCRSSASRFLATESGRSSARAFSRTIFGRRYLYERSDPPTKLLRREMRTAWSSAPAAGDPSSSSRVAAASASPTDRLRLPLQTLSMALPHHASLARAKCALVDVATTRSSSQFNA